MIRKTTLLAASLVPLLTLSAIACGGGPTPPGGSGGASGAGGSPGIGGGVGTGGGVGAGGIVGAGGAPGAGGTSSGGAGPGAGGAASGGTGPGSGGGTGSGGGGPATAEWGLVENPGAECSVGPMPSFDSLTADPKLPDPFMKMDGTRMTDKSEWVCRREEILQQLQEFVWGGKPVPADGAVSGTVSTNSITVQAEGDVGTASFSVTVNMNGATAPAPAIILYSGTPVPSGVATITFSAIEQDGGSGPKTGPFYTAYGATHPAGYLAAQAWQVSRILDVLEQNPGTIDPLRVGVTGCSRNGKGAFVGGALDNRIALTIPIESGLGGTVGLRLIEVIGDPGMEWPYHGISYVRWMSEVALGQFTTFGDAASDNTDKLPVDMHEMMALIAPRGLLIADNPHTDYNGLDRKAAWITGNVGKMIFEGLGVGDNFTYQGASGSHCNNQSFRYTAAMAASVDKFLKGNTAAATGTMATDLPNPPNHLDHIDWTVPTLTGEL